MIHTHPDGMARMSSIDWNMVYGWVQALGVPIVFVVATKDTRCMYLCKRENEEKSKIVRDTINAYTDLVYEGLEDAVYFLSTGLKPLSEDTCDCICRIFNRDYGNAFV